MLRSLKIQSLPFFKYLNHISILISMMDQEIMTLHFSFQSILILILIPNTNQADPWYFSMFMGISIIPFFHGRRLPFTFNYLQILPGDSLSNKQIFNGLLRR